MADDKDPFAEFGGTVVTAKDDPFKEFGGVVVKHAKSPLPAADISPTTPQANLSPVLPQYRDQVRHEQQAKIKQQSDRLTNLRNQLPKEAQDNLDKAIQVSNAKHPDELGAPTKEETDHYNFMQTPLGKTLGAVGYIGSQATHGTLQLAKGAAHLASMGVNPASMVVDDPTAPLFDKLDKAADFGLTKGDKSRIEDGNGLGNHLIAAAGQMANFAPTILGGELAPETHLPKALLYLQGVGQGKELADKLPALNPMAKEALIQGSGAVNLALADFGGKLFGKGVSSSVKDKVVQGIAADALKEAAGKEVTADGFTKLIKGGVQSFADKFERAPAEALKHYVDAAKTFTKLDVGNFAVHKGVDALNDKPVFNESLGNLAENLNKSYTQTAPVFGSLGALGAASKLLPNSSYENDAVKSIIADPAEKNVSELKSAIEEHGQRQGWTPEEIKATHEHVDKITKAVQSLPPTIPEAKRSKAVGLVLDRNELQGELDKSVADREKLDPAIAEQPSAKEQYLNDKVEQANDKLRDIVGGTRSTYSKGIGEEEGKFFKTTDGNKEEITPQRYDLENTEREARKEITNNSPINTTENEKVNQKSSEEIGSPASEIGESRSDGNAETNSISLEETRPVVENSGVAEVAPDNLQTIKPNIQDESTNEKVGEQPTGQETGQGGNEKNGSEKSSDEEEKVSEANRLAFDSMGNQVETLPTDTERPDNVTGIRNADVATERGENVPRPKMTVPEIVAEGKRLVDSGEVNPDELAKQVVAEGKPITAEQEAALLYHKTRLKNKQSAILKDDNPENNVQNQVDFLHNETLLEQNRQATELAGNIGARALGFRANLMKEDYSLETLLRRAKLFNGGEEVDKPTRELLKAKSERIERLEADLQNREEQIRKLQESVTISEVSRNAKLEEREAKRTTTRASLRKEREDILAELQLAAKRARMHTGANRIPVDMVAPLAKLARNYVLDGAITLSSVVDKVYSDLKDHIEGLDRSEVEALVKNGFDDYLSERNKLRLEKAKKTAKTKLENLKEEAKSPNPTEKRVQQKLQVDQDYLNIRAEINRQQMLINKKMADLQKSQRTQGQYVRDMAVKLGRNLKLASVTVLGKLMATGATTMGMKALTEGVGKGWSALLPRIARKSTIEGSVSRSALKQAAAESGSSVANFAQAYAKAATQGMKDAYDEVNIKAGGASQLNALYGKFSASRLPAEAMDFLGHLHSAIKAPIKRFAFEQSYAKRIAKGIQAGIDITDPIVDAKNRLDAYKDAERAIFMADNPISKVYEGGMKLLENHQSITGLSLSKNTAALARILLPFVKVPTNIALSTARYAFGLPAGLGKLSYHAVATGLAKVMGKTAEGLTPEESDMVLRNLKHGSVGGAALLLGFLNPKNVGGFYQPGQKHSKREAEVGGIMIGDTHIYKLLTEHPIFQAMHIGATYRRYLDAHRHKEGSETGAMLATASGLAEGIPLANGAKNLTEALGSAKKWNTYWAGVAKGEVVPAFLDQLATAMDTKNGDAISLTPANQNKREPKKNKGFVKQVGQTIETGIPGLRKNVPIKH